MRPELGNLIPGFLSNHKAQSPDRTKAITPEVAFALDDIKHIRSRLDGTPYRVTEVVRGGIGLTSLYLGDPEFLRILCNPIFRARDILPIVAFNTIEEVLNHQLTVEEGRKALKAADSTYGKAFQALEVESFAASQ